MKHAQKEKGAVLMIIVVFFFSISLILLGSATSSVLGEVGTHRALASSKHAHFASEASIEDALYRVINDQLLSDTEILKLNGGTSTLSVITISPTEKDFYSTGIASARTYKQYVKAKKTGGIVSLNYAVQTGDGGGTFAAGSRVTGNTFSSGAITGSGTQFNGNLIIASPISSDPLVQSTACDVDEIVGKANPNIDYAQSFVPNTTDTLAKISLYLKRVGSPATQTVKITSNYSSSPSTTTISSTVLNYASASTNYGWVDITFATPPSLNAGTTYWVVLDTTLDVNNYWTWCRSTSDSYGGALSKYAQNWSAGPWTAVSGTVDMAFQTYWGSGFSKMTNVVVNGTAKADTITSTTVNGPAYYQTITGSTVTGTSFPGSPTPPDIPFPISSSTIAKWKADATAGGTRGDFDGGGSLGPKKINGELRVEGATLTVTGTIYVTGRVRFENANIKCAASYGEKSCVIYSEEWDRIRDSSVFSGSGTAGSYLLLGTNASGYLEIEDNPTGIVLIAPRGTVAPTGGATFLGIYAKGVSLGGTSKVIYEPALANLNVVASSTASGSAGTWGVSQWSLR